MAFLCLLFRQAGHKTASCPEAVGKPSGAVRPGPDAVVFGSGGTTRPSAGDALCARCAALGLVDLLKHADVWDELAASSSSSPAAREASQHNAQFCRSLGPYRAIELVDSCPLCRLLFGVLPAEDEGEGEGDEYLLRPLRTHNRLGAAMEGRRREAFETRYAVSESLVSRATLSQTTADASESRFVHDSAIGIVGGGDGGGDGTAAEDDSGAAATCLPVRARGPLVDFGVVRAWLARCDAGHDECAREWSAELLTTRMMDVATRTMVACPAGCRYAALSYVWGGVKPAADHCGRARGDAAARPALPLGGRALHRPAGPVADKDATQQLGIMDRIYAGACVTLVAFYGHSSLAGLPGVTAAIHPHMAAETAYASCAYPTRGWTLQEEMLSKRLVYFGRDQLHHRCAYTLLEETVDDTVDPAAALDLRTRPAVQADSFRTLRLGRAPDRGRGASDDADDADDDNPSSHRVRLRRRQLAAAQFANAVAAYTARSLTNDDDALAACRGLLDQLRRLAHLQPFVWGLPLRDVPLALLWCHGRRAPPRRRVAFPSWSYVGWKASAHYLLDILPDADRPASASRAPLRRGTTSDCEAAFVSVHGHVLTLAACTVRLAVRCDPFSEAYAPPCDAAATSDASVGMLVENDELHPTTLPAGVFDFVVVCRLVRSIGPGRFRHVLYLLMLDGELPPLSPSPSSQPRAAVPSRRTLVRWNVHSSFIPTPAYAAMLQHRDAVQIV